MRGKKRQSKLTSAAHIKRNTEGTSNEISFSVLDAAKMELEGQLRKGPISHVPGRIALFTLPGHKKAGETPRKKDALPSSSNGSAIGGDLLPATNHSLPASYGAPESFDSREGAGAYGAPMSDSKRSERKRRKNEKREAKRAEFRRVSSDPEYEVARRKSRRKLYRVAAWTFVIAVSLVVLASVGTFAYSSYEAYRGSVQSLTGGISAIAEADEAMVVIDEFVHDPFSKTSGITFDDVEKRIEEAEESLSQAQSEIEAVIEGLGTSKEREVAENALLSIQARSEMLAAAQAVIDEAESASMAMDYVEQAWSKVLNADKLARESAVLANDTTQENIAASKEKTVQAQGYLSDALSLVTQASQVYPQFDSTKIAAYIEKRYEAFGYAIASDEAFAAEDTQKALEENDAYNKADAEAAVLADGLAVDPLDYIRDAYGIEAAGYLDSFDAAKSNAASTDSVVRSYHGV